MHKKVHHPAWAEIALPSTVIFCVCCWRPMLKAWKSLSVMVAIVAVGCTDNNNEPKPSLAGAVLPCMTFFCVCCLRHLGKAWKSLPVVVEMAIAHCTSSNNEQKRSWAMRWYFCPHSMNNLFL